jgi:hypothetical protein
MNSKQHKILEMFKRDILEHDGNGPRFMDRYEFKRWEVTESPDYGLVFLISDVGMKGDEGTLAEVFARSHRHIVIGPRGGVESLAGKKVHGYRKVLIWGYER